MLNVKTCLFWYTIIFTCITSGLVYANEDCVFSREAVSDKLFSDNDSVAVFQRFPENHEVKGVLRNGHLFSVKYWSCHHYGKQAILVIGPQIQSIPTELNDHVMQLGKVALSKNELMLLRHALVNKPLMLSAAPITLKVASGTFDTFYVQVNLIGEIILIEMMLYQS